LDSHGGKFFIYNLTSLKFEELALCYHEQHGMNVWEHEKRDLVQDLAELWLLRSLVNHPSRTYDPEEADLFYIPMLPVLSFRVGNCSGMNHAGRMFRIAAILRDSRYFRRNNGRDHLIVCGWFKCNRVLDLLNEAVGLNETSLLSISERSQSWSNWKCPEKLIIHPYVANTGITRRFPNTPFLERNTTFFFAGCERGIVERANTKILSYVRRSFIRVHKNCNLFKVDIDTYSDIISDSKFCLVPMGDTYTSRRLYDAIAAGCIPVIQDGGIRDTLPFFWKLNYSEFAIFLPEAVFRDKQLLLQHGVELLIQDQKEHEAMQTRLLEVRDELIWGGGNPFSSNATVGVVGDNVLQEAFWKVKKFKEHELENGGECMDKWKAEPSKHLIA